MSTTRTISLVSTPKRIARDFPDANRSGRLLSADYSVDMTLIKSKFGRWLAENICTTRRDDDASMLMLELPLTDEGAHFRDMGESLIKAKTVGSQEEAEAIFRRMESWIEARRRVQAAYGKPLFERRRVPFDWPVYGSAAALEAETPEAYFDHCAQIISKMNAKVIHAGLARAVPPQSLGVS